MTSGSICMENCTEHPQTLVEMAFGATGEPWNPMDYLEYQPWFFSLVGSVMVGLTGVFPLLVIPADAGADIKNGAGADTLKILLSFAVGGLLGDVFLHLLPEAWNDKVLNKGINGHPSMACGLWVLSGFLLFIIAEKIFIFEADNNDSPLSEDDESTDKNKRKLLDNELDNNNCFVPSENNGLHGKNGVQAIKDIYEKKNGICNGFANGSNGGLYHKATGQLSDEKKLRLDHHRQIVTKRADKPRHITGYLNLMANCIDNFTHGLAVGGSFLVSFRLGAFTTFAILIHELPHEIGDFAILLKSGFTRWDAAKAQMLTSSGGIFGALTAVFFAGGGVESRTSWILPFTAGGFIHIGMVSILPELLKESDPRKSLKQLAALFMGITMMAVLTIFCD